MDNSEDAHRGTLSEWFQEGKRLTVEYDTCGTDSHTAQVAVHTIDLTGEPFDPQAPGAFHITFLHGYVGSSYDYQPLVDCLTANGRLRCRLLLIDMLGFGDSDKVCPEGRFTIHHQANAILHVWAKLQVKQSHVVCHGMSVSVAQELLSRQYKRHIPWNTLGKVFFMNGPLIASYHTEMDLQQSLLSSLTGMIRARLLTEAALSSALAAMFSKEHPATDKVLSDWWKGLTHRDGQQVHHKLVKYLKDVGRYSPVLQGALTLAVRSDAARIMCLWGMQSPTCSQVAAALHQRYDPYGLRVQEHEDLGHWPHIEDPARVASALQDFVLEPWVPAVRISKRLQESAAANEQGAQQGGSASQVVSSSSLYRVSINNGKMHSAALLRRRCSMDRTTPVNSCRSSTAMLVPTMEIDEKVHTEGGCQGGKAGDKGSKEVVAMQTGGAGATTVSNASDGTTVSMARDSSRDGAESNGQLAAVGNNNMEVV